MRQIVLTGTYCSLNKGDAAMQLTLAAEATSRLGVKPVVASPFPARDRAFYAPVPVVRSTRRWLPLSLLHVAVLLGARVLRLRLRRYPFDSEINAMAQASAVVDLSGDMLTEDYGLLVATSHLMPLLQALALGRPLVICAQSIGPYRRLAGIVRGVFARAAAITVRERVSYDWLAAAGVANAHVTADLAFLLPSANDSRIAAIAAAEGLDRVGRPLLGVSVSALLGNRRNRHLPTAGGDLLTTFATALDAVAADHGVHPVLVSHVVGPGPASDDRKVSRRLAGMLATPCTVLGGDYGPGELKGVIARCIAFVGCRMHANIAALDSGVPTLAVSYSHKTEGIMAGLGQSNRVLRLADLDGPRLEGALRQLLVDAPTIRLELAAALPDARARAAANLDHVRAALDGAA